VTNNRGFPSQGTMFFTGTALIVVSVIAVAKGEVAGLAGAALGALIVLMAWARRRR
jgi:MYXO-CTERM domain-containing protein